MSNIIKGFIGITLILGCIDLLSCGPSAEEEAKIVAMHMVDSARRADSIKRIKSIKDSIELRKIYSKERSLGAYDTLLCTGHWGFDANDNNNGIVFDFGGGFMRRESLAEGSQCVYYGDWYFRKFDSANFSKSILVVTKKKNYTDYEKFDTANWYLIITPTNTILRAPSGKELNNYSN